MVSRSTSEPWSEQIKPRVGLAYCSYVPRLLEEQTGLVDYVEVPFERVRHDPTCLDSIAATPVVLHCASLSMAGVVEAAPATLDALAKLVRTSATPWLGEHLSFVTAPGPDGSVIDVGYTVAPPLNDETLEVVERNLVRAEATLGVPVLLENPPLYFETPGSTMTQVEFINRLCRATPARLLLDLTHFLITSRTCGFDAREMLSDLPLDRVVEIHVSGASEAGGVLWDDHATPAAEPVFAMLEMVARCSNVRAVTLEYNWSSRFSARLVRDHVDRVRHIIGSS